MVLERPEVMSVGSRSDGDRQSLSFPVHDVPHSLELLGGL